MRKFLLFLFVAAAAASLLPAQHAYNLSHIATGSFPQGSIRTTFVLFNNSDVAADVQMTLRDNSGNPLSVTLTGMGTASVFDFGLEAGQTRFLQTDTAGALREGSAVIRTSSAIGVSAIFAILDRNGRFLTESGISASEAFSGANLAIDVSATANTGVALQNLQDRPVTVTFHAWRSDGTLEAGPVTRDLPPNGHLGVFTGGPGGLFPQLGNFRGVLAVEPTEPIAALTLRQNSSPLSFTTLPVTRWNAEPTSFTLPQVANGGGIIKTTFVLFGLGSAAQVTIDVVDDDGAPYPLTLTSGQTGSRFTFDLEPNGAVFAETNAAGPIRAGAARIVSTARVGAAGIFTILNAQGGFATETGVGASPELEEFTLPVDMTGTFDTGLALYNTGASAAQVQLSFLEESSAAPAGSEGETLELTLNAGAHSARFASEFFARGRRGMLSVQSSAPLSALTLRQNTNPLSFTTLPVERGVPRPGGGNPLGNLVLPRSVSGLTLTSNQTLDQSLPGGFTIRGVVTLPQTGGPFPTAFLAGASARAAGGAVYFGTFNEENEYLIVVPAGTYTLQFCYSALDFTSGASMQVGSEVTGVVVNADVTRNIMLTAPTQRTVSGRLTGLAGLPPAFEDLTPILNFTPEAGGRFSAVVPVVDPDGGYSVRLADGDYRVSVGFAPLGGEEFAQLRALGAEEPDGSFNFFDIGRVTISGNATGRNFPAPSVVRVSGVVSRAQGGALPPQTFVTSVDMTFPLEELDTCFFAFFSSLAEPGPARDYLLYLTRARTHDLSATMPATSAGLMTVPGRGRNLQNYTADAVLNFTFPAFPAEVTLSGRITNAAGQPLQGIIVTASSENLTGLLEGISYSGTAVTNEQGRYTLPVLSGAAYRVDFTPMIFLP